MTLQNTDLFIVERAQQNYKVDFDNLQQYIPGIPAGSRCLFHMNSSPFGWVLDSTAKTSEATVRIVSGPGGGSGGKQSFSNVLKNWTTSVPTHKHGISVGTHKHGGSVVHGHDVNDPLHGHSAGGYGSPHNHSNNGPTGVGGGGPGGGPGVYLHKWSWRLNELVESYPSDGGGAGGTPTAGKTGVSVVSKAVAISFASGKTSGLSTTNTTGNVGNSIDFTVKYHKGILCQKDVY